MEQKKPPTVASLPLPVYLLILALTLLCMALDCVPPNLVGAFLLLMVLGEGLNKLGNTIPVVRTYLGGSVFCIFGGALLACSGWLPQSSAALMHSFVNDQGFLIFYISALICGSLFSIDRDLLLKGAVRLVPVGLLAIFSGVMVCGLMGAAGGTGFWDNILYIAVPMTSGGMTAGTVPLSHTFAEVLGVDAGDVLTRMAPATVLGNCLAIIFAGLLNDLGHRRPQLTGNGQLVNDGQPPRGADPRLLCHGGAVPPLCAHRPSLRLDGRAHHPGQDPAAHARTAGKRRLPLGGSRHQGLDGGRPVRHRRHADRPEDHLP